MCKSNPITIRLWILWLLHVNIVACLSLSISSNQASSRVQRAARCGIDHFSCKDGSCILNGLECDGTRDCSDGSDETLECKNIPCSSIYGYRCNYGACVTKTARCNGIKECADNSDEQGCNVTSPSQQLCKFEYFACKDGSCRLNGLECDGKMDCNDGSDETLECRNFPCSPFYEYRCNYGACVTKSARCNGIKDCADNSDEQGCNATNLSQHLCDITKFTCSSGECIDNNKLCDGHADCSDNSDETPDCATLSCVNAFRCKYGGCADKNARCNGIQECFDASDETDCGSSRNGGCLVPQLPSNGEFFGLKPGDYAPNFGGLITKCKVHSKVTPPFGRDFPICFNGNWTSSAVNCARFCKSLINGRKTTIACKFEGFPLDSCTDPVEGTVASINCETLYEGDSMAPVRICTDGSWDYPIAECRPTCGKIPVKGTVNILDGQLTRQIAHPWHVGIYANDSSKTFKCGGSIINERIILTAAHCVTDPHGDILPKGNYLIAAGKHYRPYNDKRDKTAQYFTIKNIYKPERYKGADAFYEADIAILVLNSILEISIAVQPVCIDWNNEFEYQQLTDTSVGVVVGWGFPIDDRALCAELKKLDTPYITYEQCYEQVPKDFRRYLTFDKVCARFLNNGTPACRTESGAGLTFSRKSTDRYYIRGVGSTSPGNDEDTSDPNQYTTFTLISKYLDFIKNIEIQNRI